MGSAVNSMITLAQVFGKEHQDIGQLVSNFDFSKVSYSRVITSLPLWHEGVPDKTQLAVVGQR